MDVSNRSLMIFGGILIGVGVVFLALNLIPGWTLGMAWPLIFWILAAGFILPVFLFPSQRQWISALFIPGSILLALGLIFFYNVITRDWGSWAYAWLLIPVGVGLGLFLAGRYGAWGRGATQAGVWVMAINLALFAVFAALFGGPVLKMIGPVLLVLAGLVLLVLALRR